jgi:hypothetical protein
MMGAIHVTVSLRASQKSTKKYEADFLVDAGAIAGNCQEWSAELFGESQCTLTGFRR